MENKKSLLIQKMIEKKITVSTAESCTGGMLASSFTDEEGVSEVFMEGIVTYANEAKFRLGVKKSVVEKYGAVSHQTAISMAKKIRERAGTDIGISTTGIAGPGGGTHEKPVGLVYIGISTKKASIAIKNNFTGTRDEIRTKTVEKIFSILERLL